MDFRTIVEIGTMPFRIEPMEQMLFVGSCFADNIGKRFVDNKYDAVVNPFGVMYNPASIMHTVERLFGEERKENFLPRIVFFTLGTNHVYRLKETGEIVDNCQKRPACLFQEEELTVDECASCLMKAIDIVRSVNPDVHVILTVSPIRYAKYGYHESQLSKATLLLAADKCVNVNSSAGQGSVSSFPGYEIVNDELRDYRFYAADMLHPSPQAVDFIWERLVETCFSDRSRQWLKEWKPVRDALNHRPFNPASPDYLAFMEKTKQLIAELEAKYNMPLCQLLCH